MKKGEIKKREILQTAETLFCRYGYEKTSIQNILDILHTSKGSFYHHYASKELLLEEICRIRADALAEKAVALVRKDNSPIENLNILFSGMMPLSGEKLDFLLMILPVFDMPEGRLICLGYAESISDAFRTMTIREIQRGNENGDIFCPDEQHAADMAFLILNELWYQICLLIIRSEKTESRIELSGLLNIIGSFRGSLERLLSAPFSSFRLLDLEDMKDLTEQIHHQWKQNNIE